MLKKNSFSYLIAPLIAVTLAQSCYPKNEGASEEQFEFIPTLFRWGPRRPALCAQFFVLHSCPINQGILRTQHVLGFFFNQICELTMFLGVACLVMLYCWRTCRCFGIEETLESKGTYDFCNSTWSWRDPCPWFSYIKMIFTQPPCTGDAII